MRIVGKGTPAFLVTNSSVIQVTVVGRIGVTGQEHLLVREGKTVGTFHKKATGMVKVWKDRDKREAKQG